MPWLIDIKTKPKVIATFLMHSAKASVPSKLPVIFWCYRWRYSAAETRGCTSGAGTPLRCAHSTHGA